MAELIYQAKILADVDAMRKSIERGLAGIGFDLASSSMSSARAELTEKIRPKLHFDVNKNSLKTLSGKISSSLAAVKVNLDIDEAKLAQQIQAVATKAIKVDVSITDSKSSFQNIGKITDELAARFDKIGQAKDRFAANVASKFPQIIAHVDKLNTALDSTSNKFNINPRVGKPSVGPAGSAPAANAVTPVVTANADASKETEKLRKEFSALQKEYDLNSARLGRQTQELSRYSAETDKAAKVTDTFGGRIGLTTSRLAAYMIPAATIFQLSRGIGIASGQIVELNRSFVQLSQIRGRGAGDALNIAQSTLKVAEDLGQSGIELLDVTKLLAQSGAIFSEHADDLIQTTRVLGQTQLAATFGDIAETTQGALAYLNQFNLAARDLASVLDTANILSRDFAVEASDLFEAVERGGAAFAALGGGFEEFQSVVTSLRQLTRLSASQIGTGLNTMVLSVFNPENLQFIRNMGVEVSDAQGNFLSFTRILQGVGERFRDLNQEQRTLLTTRLFDVRQSKFGLRLLEDLGQEGRTSDGRLKSVTLDALEKSKEGVGSLNRDAQLGLQRIDVQLQRVGTAFQQAFLSIATDPRFGEFIKSAADGLTLVARILEQIAGFLPTALKLGTAFAAISIVRNRKNFLEGLTGAKGDSDAFVGTVSDLTGGGRSSRRASAARTAGGAPQVTPSPVQAQIIQTSRQNTAVEQNNTKATQQATAAITNLTRAVQTNTTATESPIQGPRNQPFGVQPAGALPTVLRSDLPNPWTTSVRGRVSPHQLNLDASITALRATTEAFAATLSDSDISRRRRFNAGVRARDIPTYGIGGAVERTDINRSARQNRTVLQQLFGLDRPSYPLRTQRRSRDVAFGNRVSRDPSVQPYDDDRFNPRTLSGLQSTLLPMRTRAEGEAVGLRQQELRQMRERQRMMDMSQNFGSQEIRAEAEMRDIANGRAQTERNLETLSGKLREVREIRLRTEQRMADLGPTDSTRESRQQRAEILREERRQLQNAGLGQRNIRQAEATYVKAVQDASKDVRRSQAAQKDVLNSLNSYRDAVRTQATNHHKEAQGGLFSRARQGLGSRLTSLRGGIRQYGGTAALIAAPFAAEALSSSNLLSSRSLSTANGNRIDSGFARTARANQRRAGARGALTGAAMGGATGFMIGGPVGAAVGAVGVGLISAISSLGAEADKTRDQLLSLVSQTGNLGDAAKSLSQIFTNYQDEATDSRKMFGSFAGTFSTIDPAARLSQDLAADSPSAAASRQALQAFSRPIIQAMAAGAGTIDPSQVSGIFKEKLYASLEQTFKGENPGRELTDKEYRNINSLTDVISQNLGDYIDTSYKASESQVTLTRAVSMAQKSVEQFSESMARLAINSEQANTASKFGTQARSSVLDAISGSAPELTGISEDFANIVSERLRIVGDRGELSRQNVSQLTLGLLSDEEQQNAVLFSELRGATENVFQSFISAAQGMNSQELGAPEVQTKLRGEIDKSFGPFLEGTMTEAQRTLVTRIRQAAIKQIGDTEVNADETTAKELTEGLFRSQNLVAESADVVRNRLMALAEQASRNAQVFEAHRIVIQQNREAVDNLVSTQLSGIGRLSSMGVDNRAIIDMIGDVLNNVGTGDVSGATNAVREAQRQYLDAIQPFIGIVESTGQNLNPGEITKKINDLFSGRAGVPDQNQLANIGNLAKGENQTDIFELHRIRGIFQSIGRVPGVSDRGEALIGAQDSFATAVGTAGLTTDQFGIALNKAIVAVTNSVTTSENFVNSQTKAVEASTALSTAQDRLNGATQQNENRLRALSDLFGAYQKQLGSTLQTNSGIARTSTTDILNARVGVSQSQRYVRSLGDITNMNQLSTADPAALTTLARELARLPDVMYNQISQGASLFGNRAVGPSGITGTNLAEIMEALRGAGRLGDPAQNIDVLQTDLRNVAQTNDAMRQLEMDQASAMFDIARNTQIAAEALLHLTKGQLNPNGPGISFGDTARPQTPMAPINGQRSTGQTGGETDRGLSSSSPQIGEILTALQDATKANIAGSEQVTKAIFEAFTKVAGGGGPSTVSVEGNFNVTGFENTGKDVAAKAIVIQTITTFMSQLDQNDPTQAQLWTKFNTALRQIQSEGGK